VYREEAIKHKLCPQWLKDAKWEGRVELSEDRPYVTWKYGTWKNGIWKYGTWKNGIWKDGFWERGIWEDGIWERGIWEAGIWKGGYKSIGQCSWGVYYSNAHIRIGCKTKTVEEWKEWFAGDEVYNHKRDSEQFKKIKQAYLMALACIEIEKGAQ